MALQERDLRPQGAKVVHTLIPDGRQARLFSLPRIEGAASPVDQHSCEETQLLVTKRLCLGHMAKQSLLPRIAFEEIARQRAIHVARRVVCRKCVIAIGGETRCEIFRAMIPRHTIHLSVRFQQTDAELISNGVGEAVVEGTLDGRTVATFGFTLQMRPAEAICREWMSMRPNRSEETDDRPTSRLDRRELAKRLPHGPSFRFLDEVFVKGDLAIGFLKCRASFDDGQGLLNPFILEEAGAHAGIALLSRERYGQIPFFSGVSKTRIFHPAPVPINLPLEVEARLIRLEGKQGTLWTEGRVGGVRVLESEAQFALVSPALFERLIR